MSVSTIHQANVLDDPLSEKWHSGFTKIYRCRALLSLRKTTTNVDPKSLTRLVKEKILDRLHEFDGVHGVASVLKTDIDGGICNINDEDIAQRREKFGSNTYMKPPSKSFFHFMLEALKNVTILILSNLKGYWYDRGSIFVAVFLFIAVSAVSDYSQSRQFDKLSKVNNNIQVEVIRKGRRQQISIFDVVVGDVVYLKIGDQVPADGLFLNGHSLQVDESSMTRENDHVETNSSQSPFLFSGTKVADGYGGMIVTSIGRNTRWGEMISEISRDNGQQTLLQARLSKLTSAKDKVGMTVAFLVLLVLLTRYFTGTTADKNGNRDNNGSKPKANNVVNAVDRIIASTATIVVVAIPEGLPLAVTLTLDYTMKRMMIDQAMVRKLSACETMGSATISCADKTGTLTLNQMKGTKFWLGQESIEKGCASLISPRIVELIQDRVALNTTGTVHKATTGFEFEISGRPTEKAILSWATQDLSMDMEKIKQSCITLQVDAFNSKKKKSGVMMRKKIDNTINVYWQGAAEMNLEKCSS